jgi:hypothetical protein
MSLTRQLRTPGTPVRLFFDAHFDDRLFSRFVREVQAVQRSWGEPVAPLLADASEAWVVGTAFDYLVRADTWGVDPTDTVAYTGLLILVTLGLKGSDIDRLRRCWQELVEVWPRAGQDEALLYHLVVVLAWYESIRRSALLPQGLQKAIKHGLSLDQLIELVNPLVVQDLKQLLEAYRATMRPKWVDVEAVLNPVFFHSIEVGGADADWIVEQTLWELKTTINPRKNLGQLVKQLVGYLLLDAIEEYRIAEVAVYYSRFAKSLSWPVQELLARVSGRDRSLEEWRLLWQHQVLGLEP